MRPGAPLRCRRGFRTGARSAAYHVPYSSFRQLRTRGRIAPRRKRARTGILGLILPHEPPHPVGDIVVSIEHPKANLEGFRMRNYASFAIGSVVLLAPFAASSHFLLME